METTLIVLLILLVLVLAALHAYAQNRRLRRLLRTGDIPELVKMGWRVESEVGDHVIVVKSHRVNHILHFFVTLFTLGLWLIPWIFIAITGGERRKTARKPVAPPKRGL